MEFSYLGPSFNTEEVTQLTKQFKANSTQKESIEETSEFIAKEIHQGKIVGWFQGRMEFGPRALGNRSILGSPAFPEMQKRLNLKIKYREGFRPFAPSVLAEDARNYFQLKQDSPYMLLTAEISEAIKKPIPPNYYDLSLKERLYQERSDLQAITHLDFSARVQTVSKESNFNYYTLLQAAKKESGIGVLVNTSFNVRGEPIVNTPEDAYRCFMATEMDYLVINNFIFQKEKQPDWQNREKWNRTFEKD